MFEIGSGKVTTTPGATIIPAQPGFQLMRVRLDVAVKPHAQTLAERIQFYPIIGWRVSTKPAEPIALIDPPLLDDEAEFVSVPGGRIYELASGLSWAGYELWSVAVLQRWKSRRPPIAAA